MGKQIHFLQYSLPYGCDYSVEVPIQLAEKSSRWFLKSFLGYDDDQLDDIYKEHPIDHKSYNDYYFVIRTDEYSLIEYANEGNQTAEVFKEAFMAGLWNSYGPLSDEQNKRVEEICEDFMHISGFIISSMGRDFYLYQLILPMFIGVYHAAGVISEETNGSAAIPPSAPPYQWPD